jgi:predicted metal-dependent hydrolase
MAGSLSYGHDSIPYEVLFLSTRKTLSIEVFPNGRVLVRAPLGCPEGLILERLHKRAGWISRQLAEFASYRPRTPTRQYLSGETHLYLGRRYRLKVASGSTAGVKILGGRLVVSLPGEIDPDRVKAQLNHWYLSRARTVFTEVLEASLPRFEGIERPRLWVRQMRSRWGSLSPANTMTLNVNLVRAPRPCIEYVVIHELCHTRQRNHDTSFFRLLTQVMPDWQQRKQRLEQALL